MKRRIIQIASTEAGAENGYSRHLLALADDGTLWERGVTYANAPQVWVQIEPLPDNVLSDDIAF